MQCAKERPSPPETDNIASKNVQGREGLSLAHWLSYGKLNLCMLCGAVKDGYATEVKLASLGCRSGGINPITASKMWKRVVLPKILYGCELWLLNKAKCLMLKKCQNVILSVIEGLLPGTSGSAARGLLGL